MRIKKSLKMLLAMAFAFVTVEQLQAQMTFSGNSNKSDFTANPGILPPHSSAFGKTYGEWSAEWWRWLYSIPHIDMVDPHPLFVNGDETNPAEVDCSEGQTGKVWFLGGTFTSTQDGAVVTGVAHRKCTIPPGKALFFPILNGECNTLEIPEPTEGELLNCANDLADHIQGLEVTIDGRKIEHLQLYRVQYPQFEYGPLPEFNILNAEPGTLVSSAADGYFVMLAPLSAGKHKIHFEGEAVFTEAEDGFDFTFRLDITYYITVGKKNKR